MIHNTTSIVCKSSWMLYCIRGSQLIMLYSLNYIFLKRALALVIRKMLLESSKMLLSFFKLCQFHHLRDLAFGGKLISEPIIIQGLKQAIHRTIEFAHLCMLSEDSFVFSTSDLLSPGCLPFCLSSQHERTQLHCFSLLPGTA